ncbi:MAG: hypothetical protein AAGF74_08250 [Pseudomonadota bacterium]
MTLVRVLVALAFSATCAAADTLCGPRDEITAKLKTAFGETRTGMGTSGPKKVLEIWRSEETGSWSAVMSDTKGRACIVASGRDWTALDETLDDPA